MTDEARKKIWVNQTPHFDKVNDTRRNRWVGIEMPIATEAALNENPPVGIDLADNYVVAKVEAIRALEANLEKQVERGELTRNKRAKEIWFWTFQGGIYQQYMAFPKDCCKEIA